MLFGFNVLPFVSLNTLWVLIYLSIICDKFKSPSIKPIFKDSKPLNDIPYLIRS